jgi:RimJ/RimL family protein N-acetyltransferase
MVRHLCESGVGDNPIFTPVINPPKEEELKNTCERKWPTDLDQVGWGRTWGVFLDERIIGHLDLNGAHIPSGMHRIDLSMGLEESFRNQQFGQQLMTEAMAWIKKQEFIEFVDLGVFTHNEGARKLYMGFGFKEIGRIDGRFRVFGETIDDIIMVHALKRS